MNLISTDLSSKLTAPHVSTLMFIKLRSPALSLRKSTGYASSWLRNHRGADDTRVRTAGEKSRQCIRLVVFPVS